MGSSNSAEPSRPGDDDGGSVEIAGATRYLGLDEFADEPRIHDILIDHAIRGIRIQVVLRLFLSLFVLLTVSLDPPAHAETFSVDPHFATIGASSAAVTDVLADLRIDRRRRPDGRCAAIPVMAERQHNGSPATAS